MCQRKPRKTCTFRGFCFSKAFSACSDNSHYRGEFGAEKANEARIEEAIYQTEAYKEAYNDGGLYAIYCFEGMLDSISGSYVEVDQLLDMMDTIESWYGEDVAEQVLDLIRDLDLVDSSSVFDQSLDSLREEFK